MLYEGYEDLAKRYPRERYSPGDKPGIPKKKTQSFFSPELSGQKHSMYDVPIGTTERERTDIFNVGRGQIQTATDVAMEQMREIMGSRGFRAGESGIADTILGGIAKEGQRTLSQFGKEISIEESRRRFEESLAKGEFGLKREGFEYGKEMEAIRMLMQMFFGGQQAQQARWEPYWQCLIGSYTR